MANFPTLSQNPCYPLEEEREDSTIRTEFDAGYEQTRPRFTRIRKSWQVKYHALPDSDKSTLDTFIDTVREGADAFSWVNPQDSQTYTVRFKEIPKCKYIINGYWDVEFTLRTV